MESNNTGADEARRALREAEKRAFMEKIRAESPNSVALTRDEFLQQLAAAVERNRLRREEEQRKREQRQDEDTDLDKPAA